MNNKILITLTLILIGCGSALPPSPPSAPPSPQGADLVTWQGGSVMHNSKTFTIFWGADWRNQQAKMNDTISFLKAFSNSSYLNAVNEYYDNSGPLSHDTSRATYNGFTTDYSEVPPSIDITDNSSVDLVVNEICNIVHNNPDPNTIYLVYSSTPLKADRQDCAWHSAWACRQGYGKLVAFSFFPNLDEASNCHITSGPQNETIASIANVTAHEVVETITDPEWDNKLAWVDTTNTSAADSNGEEVADKCAWAFPYDNNENPAYETLTDGSQWKLQMTWSNKAYQNKTGLRNNKNQYGCIYK